MNHTEEIEKLEMQKDKLIVQYNSLLQGTSKSERIKKQKEKKKLNGKMFKVGKTLYQLLGEKIFNNDYLENIVKKIIEAEKAD